MQQSIGPIKEATIFITNKCNLKCKMCFMHGISSEKGRFKLEDPYGQLSMDSFKVIVDDLVEKNPHCTFFLMGGEPFLHPNLLDMVKYIKATGNDNYVDINTNGTRISEDILHDLMDNNLNLILYSLDGHNAELCDEIRGKGVFESVITNIKKSVEIKNDKNADTELGVHFVLTSSNYLHMEEMIHLCNQLNVDLVFFSLPTYVTDQDGEASRAPIEKIFSQKFESWKGLVIDEVFEDIDPERLISEIKKVDMMDKIFDFEWLPFGQTPHQLGNYFNESWEKNVKNKKCENLRYRTTILPDGSVTPCTTFFDLKAGNIHDQSIYNIWHGEKYETFRRLIDRSLLPICSRCCDLLDESNGNTYVSCTDREDVKNGIS